MAQETKTQKNTPSNFPVQSLAENVALITKIIKVKGDVGCSVKEMSLATGIGEGTLLMPVSTAGQYGLYESTYGAGYKTTPLFHRIFAPTFPEDKKKAEHEALTNPPLYKRLLEEFNGKVLPNQAGFANHLVREFGFKQYAIPKIVKAFFENFSPYIDANNKLRFMYTEEITTERTPDFNNNGDGIIKPPLGNTQGKPELPDKTEGYTVHIWGAGINSTLSLTEEEDFLILNAMLNKLKKKIDQNNSGTQ